MKARLVATVAVALVALSGCAASPEPDSVPSMEGPEFITGARQHVEQMHACMIGRGFEGELADPSDPGGGSVIDFPGVPDAQQDELSAALTACVEDVGPVPIDLDDPAVLRETYDWLAGQRDCLEEAGFAAGPKPSWQAFQDEYLASGAVRWDPVAGATEGGEHAAYNAALAACPRTTAEW